MLHRVYLLMNNNLYFIVERSRSVRGEQLSVTETGFKDKSQAENLLAAKLVELSETVGENEELIDGKRIIRYDHNGSFLIRSIELYSLEMLLDDRIKLWIDKEIERVYANRTATAKEIEVELPVLTDGGLLANGISHTLFPSESDSGFETECRSNPGKVLDEVEKVIQSQFCGNVCIWKGDRHTIDYTDYLYVRHERRTLSFVLWYSF